MLKLILSILISAVALPVIADVTAPSGRTIDCFCTDKSGSRVELGEYICLRVDGRMFMAQCQMSLNVPMWREISPGCLSSQLNLHNESLPQSLQIANN